jgi:hypothetical protein
MINVLGETTYGGNDYLATDNGLYIKLKFNLLNQLTKTKDAKPITATRMHKKRSPRNKRMGKKSC